MRKVLLVSLLMLVLAACGSNININLVPTTGDTAADSASAQNAMPNLSNYGYTSTEATNITQAISAVGGSATLITANPAVGAAILKIDDMMQCYQGVGAVSARVYTDANIAQVTTGTLPKVGALAIINRDRITRNLLSCALSFGSGIAAQSAAIEPCAGSGSVVRNGETLDFVYAATDPQLCTLFAAAMQ